MIQNRNIETKKYEEENLKNIFIVTKNRSIMKKKKQQI